MTGQQLKASILQLAIQGKLVPQNPDDEPASVLLDRIRKEKEKLIRENKLKKDKNPSAIFRGADGLFYEKTGSKQPICIQDEIPFEIPNSWEWTRIGYVSTYANTKQKVKSVDVCSSTWGLDLEDIEKGGRILYRKTVGERPSIGDKTVFRKGDILYSKLRPYLLKILVAPEDGVCSSEIVPFQVYGSILSEYIVDYLKSPYVDNLINSITYGVKMPRVGTDTMISLLVPVPPVKEQKRIVDKLSEVLPMVKDYGTVERQLVDYNTSFSEQLKKSLLQYAMQGKLVPQNPDDEPASVLLERIRDEKKKLVKAGVVKKDKHESVIYKRDNSYYEKIGGKERCIDDEIPFDIPESWRWERLGKLTYNHGQKKPNAEFCYIDIGSIDNLQCCVNKDETVISASDAPSRARKIVKQGDILYSTVRPYLHNICIVDRNFSKEPIASTGFAVMSCFADYSNVFLFYYLLSPVFDSYANDTENSKGVAYPAINEKRLSNALVPIPPLQEQNRIVCVLGKMLMKSVYLGINNEVTEV